MDNPRQLFRFLGVAVVILITLGLTTARGVFALVSSDPLVSQQWYLDAIGAPRAWDVTIGNPATVVAVLDIGVDLDHPDLADAIWTNPREVAGNGVDDDGNGYVDDVHGWDFVGHDNDPSPAYDVPGADPKDLHHGTLVSGVIVARGNNGAGIAGIDWLARIMPLRVLRADGTGEVATVLKALRYARDEGASIVNLSFVGDQRSNELDALIADLAARKILVVAAGGNEDRSGRGNLDAFPAFPICSGASGEHVFGVAATNQQGEKAGFSSYGACVDLSAPGEKIAGTVFHDPGHMMIAIGDRVTSATFSEPYAGFFSGTSYAAPVVAGAASLLRGLLPDASLAEILSLMTTTAAPIVNVQAAQIGRLGAGRLDLGAAVAKARERLATIPDSAQSTLEVTPPLAAAGQGVVVRVTLRDRNGFLMGGRGLSLRSLRPGDAIAPTTAITDAQGVATLTVTGGTTGIAEVEAVADSVIIARGRAVFTEAAEAGIGIGSLLKGSTSSVYVIGSNGKRYAFPDRQTYDSWYADTSGVRRVSDDTLAAFTLGGLVTIRPGSSLVKIQTDTKVYTVEPPMSGSGQAGGTLRWVPTEQDALRLYGPQWARRVVDVPDAFFATYRTGAPLTLTEIPNAALVVDVRNSEKYLIASGTRRRIASPTAFLQNNFQTRFLSTVAVVDLPDGAEIVGRETVIVQPVP